MHTNYNLSPTAFLSSFFSTNHYDSLTTSSSAAHFFFLPLCLSAANQQSIFHRATCGWKEWWWAKVSVCMCGHSRADGQQKHCTKLRAALRSPPEAELRLSSLFSRTGFQLWDERDGELLCLCCGSLQPCSPLGTSQKYCKREKLHLSHLDRQEPAIFMPSKCPAQKKKTKKKNLPAMTSVSFKYDCIMGCHTEAVIVLFCVELVLLLWPWFTQQIFTVSLDGSS